MANALRIEFERPLKEKVDVLVEFVRENKLYGILDKRLFEQVLTDLDGMHVSKVACTIKRNRWHLKITINHKMVFEGEGPNFEEAVMKFSENFEDYVSSRLRA